MASPRQAVLLHPVQSTVTQNTQIIYKLFLLENARNTLEEELLRFISKAYKEVQGFFHSSSPTSVFGDLAKALDAKYQTLEKLSALLKELTAEPHICVKDVLRTNKLQPLGNKSNLKNNVLKFGPMLKNLLMASSITKAVQVLGATLPVEHFKRFFDTQPPDVQQEMTCSILSSYSRTVVTERSSSHLRSEEKEHSVVLQKKSPPDDVTLQPAIIQSAKRRPLLLPSRQAIFPEISKTRRLEIKPVISWGSVDDIKVHHQKQTSSQLLHFLRAKATTVSPQKITVAQWNTESIYTSSSSQSISPTVKIQHYQRGVTSDLTNVEAPETLSADITNHAPVFRIKRVESSGCLTYTCVIASKTELWDIGDIFTEVGEQHSENEDCQNITVHDGDNGDNGSETRVMTNLTIPEFQIRRFEETEVVVSHVISPGHFYVQQADSNVKLQALVTDTFKASSSYAEQNCIPDIGTKVMGWFHKQEQWCRAQVTKICGVSGDCNATDGAASETSIKVEVRRLDYGDTACLLLWNIRELTPEMVLLPLQALQVSLANVMPVNGIDWSEEAVGWFQAMVHNRTLYARLYPQAPKVTVELFLEKGKLGAMRRGASLSLRLAQNGHATHSRLKKNGFTKSAVQAKTRDQDSEWEKYLITCYAQSRR